MKGTLTKSTVLAALAVALLLILTAWGNAIAMFITSTIALVICLFVFRRELSRNAAVAAAVACVIACAVAFLLQRV